MTTNASAEDKASTAQIRLDLVVLFLAAFAIRMIWAFISPPWTAPDEASHFTYVSHLAEQNEIPRESTASKYPEFSDEMTQNWELMLLGSVSRVGSARRPDYDYFPVRHDFSAARRVNTAPEQRRSAAGATASTYPPLYYAWASLGYRMFYDAPLLSRLYAVRASSAILGALSCCFGYLLAYELLRSRAWGRALGLSMALVPMYAFMNGSVNNDAGMVLGCSVLSWLIVRMVRRKDCSLSVALAIGLVGGATMLTKPTGSPVVLAACAAVGLYAFPIEVRPFRLHLKRVRMLAALTLGILSTFGAWTVYRMTSGNFSETGLSSQESDVLLTLTQGSSYSLLSYIKTRLSDGCLDRLMIRGYWGNFGWLELPLPRWTFATIKVFYAFGLTGFVAWLVRKRSSELSAAAWTLVGLVFGQLLFVFLVADYVMMYARTGEVLGLQGRYFHPTLAPMLMILLLGVRHLLRDHRWAPQAVSVFLLALNVIGIRLMLLKWYGVSIG